MANEASDGEWAPVRPMPAVDPIVLVDRAALAPIPEHMHQAIVDWVEKGEPYPNVMEGFFRAVLINDFGGAVMRADHMNARCLREWAMLLYNDVPSPCWGTAAKLMTWYDLYHPKQEV